ncbi:MAG: DNA repair exonuclease [Gemmatimonadetes bacterium]|nr:DNA repair exonuclease [Gemmatimonadota bacterium]
MRIVHLADVHLDRRFVGMPLPGAKKRRAELKEAFRRCLAVAREQGAEAVTIGGDLWEDEHVTADTRNFVADELRQLPCPVLLIGGNHDPLLAGGNHLRTPWPESVRLFRTDQPTEERLGEVSIWGVSWTGGNLTSGFLDTFRVPDDGRTHLLLLHGTSRNVPAYLTGGVAYCSFTPEAVRRAGFALCLSGHIHAASIDGVVVYPGSPEPLGWGEMGMHAVAVADVGTEGCEARLVEVNRRRYLERRVGCAEATSSAAVEEAVARALNDPEPAATCLRLELVGQISADCEIDGEALVARHRAAYAELVVRDLTTPAYDYASLARQPTAVGRFVKILTERLDASEGEEREVVELALIAGLRAVAGRKDVLHVD